MGWAEVGEKTVDGGHSALLVHDARAARIPAFDHGLVVWILAAVGIALLEPTLHPHHPPCPPRSVFPRTPTPCPPTTAPDVALLPSPTSGMLTVLGSIFFICSPSFSSLLSFSCPLFAYHSSRPWPCKRCPPPISSSSLPPPPPSRTWPPPTTYLSARAR